jgi:fermentation-respiration switch protein FrsA (DUF1100 family)
MKVHPLAALVLTLAALWISLRWFENAMVFVPSRPLDALPGAYGLPFERVPLTASDGVRLDAWWIPGPRAESPVMLCLHGNGGNLSNRVEKMKIFHDAGAAQLWIEWRGYGASRGSPSEAGLYRDAQAGRDWLAARGVTPSRLVLYGESLGCGAAVELATRAPAAGLIMDSGFASVPEMAKLVLPWFPIGLARIRFDNLAKLPRVTMPTLFLHSTQDDVVPYEQARRNFEAAAGPKRFVELHGGHNDGFHDSAPAYGAAIRDFLASLTKETGGRP